MSPPSRVRRVHLWLLAVVQLTMAGVAIACSRTDGSFFAASVPYVVALAFGASQAVVLAMWFTLGPASWGLRLLASATLVAFYLACYFGVRLVGAPFDEWASMVGWWIGGPLAAGCVCGVWARRAGWRWRNRSEPLGSALNWSIGDALRAVVVLALVLGVARQLHQYDAPISRTILNLTLKLGNHIPASAFFNDPLIGASFFASAYGALLVMRGPRPAWVLAPVALGWAVLLGVVFTYARPSDLTNAKGMETLWACGTLAAAVNTLLMLGVLRWLGLRIDREPPEPGDRAPTTVGTFDSIE